MSIGVVIVFVVGLVLGLLIAWFYCRQQIGEHEARIQRLQTSIRDKDQNLQSFQVRLQEQEASVEQLRAQVNQGEGQIRDLTAQIEERNQAVGELEGAARERDAQIQSWKLRAEAAESQVGSLEAALEEKEQEVIAPSRAPEPRVPVTKPDNLRRIEGIGPKISQVLQSAGIMTFAQLSAADVSRLEQILQDADMTLADPTTWPEQASLATAGSWEALDTLQDELKGGRRV